MDILIINGPNLNLLGVREPAVYGNTSFDDFMKRLRSLYPHIGFDFFQSNHEGAIIDRLHADGFNGRYAGIILNAGAYTHTSLAIADAIAAHHSRDAPARRRYTVPRSAPTTRRRAAT